MLVGTLLYYLERKIQPNQNNDEKYSTHVERYEGGPTASALSPDTRVPTWGVGRTSS